RRLRASTVTALSSLFAWVFTDAYMRRFLRKGVPSLGSDLSSIFEAPAAAATPVAAGGDSSENGEGPLGRPAPVVTDAFDVRKHPVQQVVMELTKRY
ncbi:unnamed protein product, partial [Hapterophycus canaliculatus]